MEVKRSKRSIKESLINCWIFSPIIIIYGKQKMYHGCEHNFNSAVEEHTTRIGCSEREHDRIIIQFIKFIIVSCVMTTFPTQFHIFIVRSFFRCPILFIVESSLSLCAKLHSIRFHCERIAQRKHSCACMHFYCFIRTQTEWKSE